MNYMGGKKKLASRISYQLHSRIYSCDGYLEPFLGGASVFCTMSDVALRIGSDCSLALITLYKEIIRGWIPPRKLSSDEYKELRIKNDPSDPMTAFAGYGCSFGGKLWGGLASNRQGRNYCADCADSLRKMRPYLMHAEISQRDYREYTPHNKLIYCDPPYMDTTGYSNIEKFDHDEFWEIMRKWSHNNIVIISEYKAPDDFVSISAFTCTKTLRKLQSTRPPRVERLFTLHSSK